jgi:hypothetical protein
MGDDQTRPLDPDAHAPPPAAHQRPRFADQVMGMRAVVATAIACLIVGGLGGFALGRATGDDRGFGRGPHMFQRDMLPQDHGFLQACRTRPGATDLPRRPGRPPRSHRHNVPVGKIFGDIAVDSVPGKGSTFTVRIPC